jgi:hypothetical protein
LTARRFGPSSIACAPGSRPARDGASIMPPTERGRSPRRMSTFLRWSAQLSVRRAIRAPGWGSSRPTAASTHHSSLAAPAALDEFQQRRGRCDRGVRRCCVEDTERRSLSGQRRLLPGECASAPTGFARPANHANATANEYAVSLSQAREKPKRGALDRLATGREGRPQGSGTATRRGGSAKR